MQTLYIDVYFLINFSIDSLAMFFASKLIGHRIHVLRLLVSSALLSLVACLYTVLLQGKILGYLTLILTYLLATFICAKGESLWRWIALSLSFLLISFFIGGIVFWGYEKLNFILLNLEMDIKYGAEDKRMLVFALLILASICILKLLIFFLERKKTHRYVTIFFSLFGGKYEMEALVDSGCFLVEPLSGKAVFLVKKDALHKSHSSMEGLPDTEVWNWKKRMRLIPATSLGGGRMLISYLIEDVKIKINNKTLSAQIYLAIDEEGGTYGGYRALIPASVLDYA